MLAQIEKGDAVVTTGGLHGKVTGLADDVLTVEIAPKVQVQVDRAAIQSVPKAPEPREKGRENP